MRTPNRRDIQAQLLYDIGYQDRVNGTPCSFTDGNYLNGWYSDSSAHYITTEQHRILKRGNTYNEQLAYHRNRLQTTR